MTQQKLHQRITELLNEADHLDTATLPWIEQTMCDEYLLVPGDFLKVWQSYISEFYS